MIPTLLDDARRDEPPEYRRIKGLPMPRCGPDEKKKMGRPVAPVIVA